MAVPLFAAVWISDDRSMEAIESIATYLPRDEMEQMRRAIVVHPLDECDVGESIIAYPVAVSVMSVVEEGQVSRGRTTLVVDAMFLLEALIDDLCARTATDQWIGQLGADGRVAGGDKAGAVAPERLSADAYLVLAEHRDALVQHST